MGEPITVPSVFSVYRCTESTFSRLLEAAPISLFCAPNGVNELPEMRLGFAVNPDW